MWKSGLSQCLFILYHLEITRIAADTDWHYFKVKPYSSKDIFLNLKPLKGAPIAQNRKKILDQYKFGYELTDEEIHKLKMWPKGYIPYYIDILSYDKAFRDKIRRLLEEVNNLGSVQFIELRGPPSDEKTRFVMFLNRIEDLADQDYSPAYFTTEGAQRVRLTYECFINGDIYAAVLAIVGVPPQHNAPNRDRYIEVKLENVIDDKHSAFQILQNDQWLFHDMDYDFESVSHFDFFKYTKNGKATIVPKVESITQRPQNEKEFSFMDIVKIISLYNFISKTDTIKLSPSDCKKMYNAGPGLANYEPKVDQISGKAVEKPKKYLGLPDDSDDKQNDGDPKADNSSENVATPGKDDENYNVDKLPISLEIGSHDEE